MSKGDAKAEYFVKLEKLLKEYNTIFVVNVDNVGSNQMHQVRKELRGRAVILMGKNTMVRKAIRNILADHPDFEKLLPIVKGNIGFVFTNEDLKEIRDAVKANRVQAPARAGAIAPVDVYVPPGNTGMEPGQTSFFQALGIPTKISRGTIEIVNEVHLVKVGEKVGPSEATLLNKLNISPFTYGLTVEHIYDNGNVFTPEVLDITDEDLIENLVNGIKNIAALSLEISYPTVASVPHSLANGYKNLIAISLVSDYCLESVKELKELLDNPEALASLQAASAAAATTEETGAAAAAEEEEEEESDSDMGFGLFD
ncbi:ribosomal protein P0 [Piromyces finnis]|uniref:60S acidic ribosomal protein P0 n=1 Tax=Piromyces finnis TaxID=1754191 RepID=A0A1Y1VI18_9FUNG|nr:ribosomal protein P0 [Piromyces finnis]|eukprot:ORX56660.1 ribosomal protein P0 [Piromyces finnis]